MRAEADESDSYEDMVTIEGNSKMEQRDLIGITKSLPVSDNIQIQGGNP